MRNRASLRDLYLHAHNRDFLKDSVGPTVEKRRGPCIVMRFILHSYHQSQKANSVKYGE